MPPTLTDLQHPKLVNVPNVELCSVGTWNGRAYTAQELADVADTWQELRGLWDVPLTLGHDGESALGDGAPAFGWADNVHFENGTLYGDYVKVPEQLARLLPTAYPKRSCTFLEGAVIAGKKRDLVLRNVALLGAYQPAVEGLADVAALYNRRLSAEGGHTVTTEATMPPRASKKMLARLPADERVAYDAWKAAHPTQYQLISGPPMSDIQSAVMKALAAAYPPAEADSGSDAPGADGPSQNVLDWFVSGSDMSVIVSDQDIDNLFEIPFTYDASGDTASLGTPVPVKGTYTANQSGQESGGDGSDDTPDAGSGDAAPDAATAAPSADGTEQQNKRQLAAQVADTAVEDLMGEAKQMIAKLLAGVNQIAGGKPGVTDFRNMLNAAEKALDRIKVAKPTSGDGSDASTPTPKPAPAAAQNSRQEESDVKLSQLARIYGLPETATEDEVMRAAEGAAAARGVVTTLARKVDALLERDAEKEFDEQLAKAISQGRLKRWSKPGEDGVMYTTLRKLARTDQATASTMLQALPPIVDTNQYGRAGDEGDAPNSTVTPAVAQALRRLGRDPETVDNRSLDARWAEERRKKQLARAERFGLPKPDMPISRAG